MADFSFLDDEALKKKCVSNQIEAVQKKGHTAKEDATVSFHLANLYYENGNLDEAIRHYSEGLKIDPGNAQAHTGIGNALVGMGRPDEAIAHYAEALRLNPAFTDAHYNMGNTLMMAGRTRDAIKNYSEALKSKPDHTDALNNLAWIYATHRNPAYRDGTKAVQLAEKASEIDGRKRPDLLDTLAAAYAEAGQFDKARQTAQKAMELARSTGHEKWMTDIEKRLQLYQSGRPFHEGSSFTTP